MATPSLAMIPSAYADSKVYSVLPNNGDGDFTFNRDSSATRVGQNGLIQTVGFFGNELVVNGDFATDSVWVKSGSGMTISGGFANFTSGQDTFVFQDIMTIGKQYYMVLEYNISSLTGSAYFGSNIGTGNAIINMAGLTGSGTLKGYITASSVRLIIRSSTLTGTITNVSVKEVLGDQPRLNYDISNGVVQSCPSLLLEPASTNVIPYSEDFSNAAWSKTNLTVTDNQTTSPDGSLNASKLTEDTSTGEHKIFDSLSITSGVDYTFSVFVKSNGRNFIRLRLENAGVGSGQINVWFDVLNGTVGTVGAGTAIIENYGNGWYRCIATGTTSATSYVAKINLSDADNNVSYTGDGTSGVYLFGAMLEEQSYATSYIPTNGSSQTRAAETCNGAGNAALFNSTEGVLYWQGSVSDVSNTYISLSDGTNTNRVFLGVSGGNVYSQVRIGAVVVADMFAGVVLANTYIKVAIKWKVNDFALWYNGVEVATDLSGVSFVNDVLTISGFNNGAIGSSPFTGKAKDVRVYNEALTDAQLTTLTTL